jgi:hypothetical protein
MRDKCFVTKRRGYVLLTVTLVGALLFVSALMFVSQLTTESHVTKTDAYFKSALNLAETGMTNVLMDIKSDEGKATWAKRFSSGGYTANPVESLESATVHGTYQVTVAVVSKVEIPDADGWWLGQVRVTSTGAVYPPSVTAMAGSSTYVARRIVRMNTVATWSEKEDVGTQPTWEYTGPSAYAVFAGTNVGIKASSQVKDGDIWANGDITIGNYKEGSENSGLVRGELYTGSGAIKGSGIPESIKHFRQGDKKFPEVNIDGRIDPNTTPDMWGYRPLFDAYVMGTFPFNLEGQQKYPGRFIDMSMTVLGGLNRAKYQVQALLDSAVPSNVTDPNNPARKLLVLPASENVSADVRAAMTNPLGVYFFNGSVKNLGGSISGTLVVNGDFFQAGGFTGGTLTTPMVLIVTKDFNKAVGNASMTGIVYVGGRYEAKGTADIVGSLIVRSEVDMTAGTSVVTYVPGLNPIGGTWKEIPGRDGEGTLYDLVLFDREADGARMWQEVTDLS